MNTKLLKVTTFALITFSIFSCRKEGFDPCKEASASDCYGPITSKTNVLTTTISPNIILDVTINPNNSNEIIFVGQPTGYDEKGLFYMNIGSNELHKIATTSDGFRHIPDWATNNLVLFPYQNNTIHPDGRIAGTIAGCPSQIGQYPKWCAQGTKVAGVRYDLPEPKTFVADLVSNTIQEYDNFGEPFEISEDGSKLVASDLPSTSIYWMDLTSKERHSIPCANQTVRSCDWLTDNHTIIWVAETYEENECGIRLPFSTIKTTDVLTNETNTVAKGCFWDQYISVKVSADGAWIYVLKNHLQDLGSDNFLNKIDLWRIDLNRKVEEFVVG